MANESGVILRDADGNMYLIGSDLLEAGKLPADKKATLSRR
jgi:hypothetical protein